MVDLSTAEWLNKPTTKNWGRDGFWVFQCQFGQLQILQVFEIEVYSEISRERYQWSYK